MVKFDKPSFVLSQPILLETQPKTTAGMSREPTMYMPQYMLGIHLKLELFTLDVKIYLLRN